MNSERRLCLIIWKTHPYCEICGRLIEHFEEGQLRIKNPKKLSHRWCEDGFSKAHIQEDWSRFLFKKLNRYVWRKQ